MDVGSLFVIPGLFFLAVVFVVEPFLGNKNPEGSGDHQIYSQLSAEKEALLAAIRQLDRDLALKKITQEIHASQREQLIKEAAVVMKKLDQLPENWKPMSPSSAGEQEDLESLIACRRREREENEESRRPS